MPTQRRRTSLDDGEDHDYDFFNWDRTKRQLKHFCSDKFWCSMKLCATFIVVLDILTLMGKWYYLQTRPQPYRLAIHIAEKVLYPYWFFSILANFLYIHYGIMGEYLWAMGMYIFNNIIHVIFLDVLLLAELVVVLKHGNQAPWTHLTVGMTVLRMVLVTLWHPFVIHVARAFRRGIKAKWRDQTLTVFQLWCPCFRKK